MFSNARRALLAFESAPTTGARSAKRSRRDSTLPVNSGRESRPL